VVNFYLTLRQRLLLELIERRRGAGLPVVQRDLAETLGIRRDSLNKLLARTRRALAARGLSLVMPPRRREVVAAVVRLEGSGR
jgi:hypothetical protein